MPWLARLAAGMVLGGALAGGVVHAWGISSAPVHRRAPLTRAERVTVGRLSIAGLPGWVYLPGEDREHASWVLEGRQGDARARFEVRPLFEAVDVLASGSQAGAKAIAVDGLEATWIEFRPQDGGIGALSLFDENVGQRLGTCLWAWALEEEWSARVPDFGTLISSIWIRDGDLEAVARTGAAPLSPARLDGLDGTSEDPSLEGTVLRGTQPVRGAVVRLQTDSDASAAGAALSPDVAKLTSGGTQPTPSRLAARALAEAVTDARGEFRFDDAPPGAICLETPAGPGSIHRARLEMTSQGSPRRRLVLQLGTGSIFGGVHDRSGSIPIRTLVRLGASVRGIRREFDTYVRDDGSYCLEGLGPGAWRLAALGAAGSGTRLDPLPVPIGLLRAERKREDLGSTVPLPRLTGRARTRTGVGLPGPSFRLLVTEVERGKTELPPVTLVDLDEAGRFEQRLPAGRYLVQLIGEAWSASPVSTTVSLEPQGSTILLTVPGVMVRGSVRAAGSAGSSVLTSAGERVTILAGRPFEDEIRQGKASLELMKGRTFVTAPLLPDGTFALYGVSPGSSFVAVRVHSSVEETSKDMFLEVPEFADVVGLQLEVPATAK